MLDLQFLEDSDTSLMLSLNHPLAPVRLLAINHLKNIMKTSKVCVRSPSKSNSRVRNWSFCQEFILYNHR